MKYETENLKQNQCCFYHRKLWSLLLHYSSSSELFWLQYFSMCLISHMPSSLYNIYIIEWTEYYVPDLHFKVSVQFNICEHLITDSSDWGCFLYYMPQWNRIKFIMDQSMWFACLPDKLKGLYNSNNHGRLYLRRITY